MSGANSPLLRMIFLPFGIAGIAIGVHRGCAERRQGKLDARQILVDRADSGFRIPADTFLVRDIRTGKPRRHLAVEYAAKRVGWPIRAQGRDSGWAWGCLQTPDSGIVLFFSFDSGCAKRSGEFWSDRVGVRWTAWDLARNQGGPGRNSQNFSSVWSYPGDDRVCWPGHADHPPDSIQTLCGPVPRSF